VGKFKIQLSRIDCRFSTPGSARRSGSSERRKQGPAGLVLFRPAILPAGRSSYSEAIVILREGYGKNSAIGARVETVDNGFFGRPIRTWKPGCRRGSAESHCHENQIRHRPSQRVYAKNAQRNCAWSGKDFAPQGFRHNGKQWGTLQKEYWESNSTGATWLYQISFSLPNELALAPRKSVQMLGGATLMAKSTVSEISRLCGKPDFKYGK
jgi:hypothetical protein